MLIANQDEVLKTIYKYHPKISNKCLVKKRILYKYKCMKAFLSRRFLTTIRMKIQSIFDSYYIIDWTDKREYDCIQFKILLHEYTPLLDDDIDLIRHLGGTRQDLRIYVSVLGKYYFCNIEETSYDENTNTWSVCDKVCNESQIKSKINDLEEFFHSTNYMKITTKQARSMVPEIRLKYIEPGNARVFDCLFTQIDGLL